MPCDTSIAVPNYSNDNSIANYIDVASTTKLMITGWYNLKGNIINYAAKKVIFEIALEYNKYIL